MSLRKADIHDGKGALCWQNSASTTKKQLGTLAVKGGEGKSTWL